MYLNYEEYLNLGGILEEPLFNEYEFIAETNINWYTFNRLKNDTEFPVEVKRCIKKLIEILDLKKQALSLGQTVDGVVTSSISSQSNDGVSISYNAMSATDVNDKCKEEIRTTIQQYLYGVENGRHQKLLYRGLD